MKRTIRISKDLIPMRKIERQFKNIKADEYLKSVTVDAPPKLKESFFQRSGVEL